MLQAQQLNKSFQSRHILKDVSLAIEKGTIYGLLGKNGAGKSTLFKILCGLLTPDSGSVHFQSKKSKPIGAIIEKPGLYTYLNAYDNLKIFAKIQKASYSQQSLENYLLNVGLPIDRKDPVKHFSMGMKQRLGIAIALLNNPDILILDEPFSGLDPTGVAAMIQLIKSLAQEGIAILISSHLMSELQKCCDYLYIIDQGSIVNHGTTSNLINTLVSLYTITANGIENANSIHNYVISSAKNNITVDCKSSEISDLLQQLLQEGFQITSCVPNITLEQLLHQQAL